MESKDLMVFENDVLGSIRGFIDENGEVWFIASDIAKILEYYQTSDMVRLLDDDEKLQSTLCLSGQGRKTNLINESGFYHAVMASHKEEAKEFRKWVTSTVLPSIRKTGSYSIPKKALDYREKSKEIRKCFTNMQKEHGYTKQYEYIQTTMQMKKKLGISAKKDDMTPQEIAAVSAAEWLSMAMVTTEQGYHEVNPVCIEASETVTAAIESKQAEKLLA